MSSRGIVRYEAGHVHVNAQLIDTRTNAQVWAQGYDPAFAIQSEIAKNVAEQLLLRSFAK